MNPLPQITPPVSDGNPDVELISQPKAYSFIEEWYDHNSENHVWFQWRLASLLRQLKRVGISMEKPYKVLEVGSGVGVLRTQVESATDWTVDITDLDLNALRQAKPGRGRKMYYDIFEQKQEYLEAYDLIVLFDVLEHVTDTQPFLTALLHHLKPKGYLLINVPALQSLYSHYDEIVGHERRYNKQTLAAEFRQHNVKIEDIRFWGMSLVPAIVFRKLMLGAQRRQPTADKVRRGFAPPHPLVQNVFLGLMHLENLLPITPFIGSSLLLVGRKL